MKNKIISKNQSVIIEKVNENEYLLLDTERGIFAGINGTGYYIWETLEETSSFNKLLERIILDFKIDNLEDVKDDIIDVIENMINSGFLYYE